MPKLQVGALLRCGTGAPALLNVRVELFLRGEAWRGLASGDVREYDVELADTLG